MEHPKLSVNMILPKISFYAIYTYKYKVNFGRCFKLHDYNFFYFTIQETRWLTN